MIASIKETGSNVRIHQDRPWRGVQRHLRTFHVRNVGYLTRINRRDGRCNYASEGTYDVTFTHPTMGDYTYTVQFIDA